MSPIIFISLIIAVQPAWIAEFHKTTQLSAFPVTSVLCLTTISSSIKFSRWTTGTIQFLKHIPKRICIMIFTMTIRPPCIQSILIKLISLRWDNRLVLKLSSRKKYIKVDLVERIVMAKLYCQTIALKLASFSLLSILFMFYFNTRWSEILFLVLKSLDQKQNCLKDSGMWVIINSDEN